MTQAESKGRCGTLIESALALLQRWGVTLLDPDFDPWSVGVPAHVKGADPFAQQQTADASTEQQLFKGVLDNALDTLRGDTRRPLPIMEVHSNSATPKNPVYLSLMYYLAVHGFPLDIDIRLSDEGGFTHHLIAI